MLLSSSFPGKVPRSRSLDGRVISREFARGQAECVSLQLFSQSSSVASTMGWRGFFITSYVPTNSAIGLSIHCQSREAPSKRQRITSYCIETVFSTDQDLRFLITQIHLKSCPYETYAQPEPSRISSSDIRVVVPAILEATDDHTTEATDIRCTLQLGDVLVPFYEGADLGCSISKSSLRRFEILETFWLRITICPKFKNVPQWQRLASWTKRHCLYSDTILTLDSVILKRLSVFSVRCSAD